MHRISHHYSTATQPGSLKIRERPSFNQEEVQLGLYKREKEAKAQQQRRVSEVVDHGLPESLVIDKTRSQGRPVDMQAVALGTATS